MKYTLGFIGVGNMGSALLFAALRSVDAERIAICDADGEKTKSLAEAYGITVLSAEEIAASADFVVLGVKPYAVEDVIQTILPYLHPDATLVSMAAGVSLWQIGRYLQDDERSMIRIMPNTPCAVGMGVVLYAAVNTSEEKKAAFAAAFSAAAPAVLLSVAAPLAAALLAALLAAALAAAPLSAGAYV